MSNASEASRETFQQRLVPPLDRTCEGHARAATGYDHSPFPCSRVAGLAKGWEDAHGPMRPRRDVDRPGRFLQILLTAAS
jgi:hypothetical protein